MKREIGLYLVFGVLTTAIAVGGYAILIHMGIHYFAATTLSWIAAVLFAFLTNRSYVFRSDKREWGLILKEGLVFFASRVSTWCIETLGLFILIDMVLVDQMVSKYIMSVVVIVLNYILSKVFVFRAQNSLTQNN